MLITKTKLQVKSNSNLTNLYAMHFKSIQSNIIKKGTVSAGYVEDKKGASQFYCNFLVDVSLWNIHFPTIF